MALLAIFPFFFPLYSGTDTQASPNLEKMQISSKIDSFSEVSTFRSGLTSNFNITWAVMSTLVAIFIYSCNVKSTRLNRDYDNLKIISYNVWYGFTKAPERKDMWTAWMHSQQPDIVSLQELNEYTPEKLAKDAKSYGHEYSVLLKRDGFPTGITSRYPIEDVKISTEGFHHGLLEARIKNIYFYVIHLHPSNWRTRNNEIGQILRKIEALPSEAEIILAGDFNTFSPLDSIYYSHRRLEPFFNHRDSLYGEKNLNDGKLDYTVIQQVMDAGLIDLEASLRNPAYDFAGSFPTLVEKEGEHGDQRRLDYIFATKRLAERVTTAQIIASDTTLVLSDHLPVVMELKLEKDL